MSKGFVETKAKRQNRKDELEAQGEVSVKSWQSTKSRSQEIE